MKRLLLIGAAVVFAASALPAFGSEPGDTGTVQAQVTVAAPCIVVGPATTIDFGALPFSSSPYGVRSSDKPISYTSCSESSQNVYLHGTDAAGTSASWALLGPGPGGGGNVPWATNEYAMGVTGTVHGGSNLIGKSPVHAEGGLEPLLAPGATGQYGLWHIWMPLSGSDGSAEVMTMSLVITATF